MRRAFELAFANAYTFGGEWPQMLEVDNITFLSPVDVGDLLQFNSRVIYSLPDGGDVVLGEDGIGGSESHFGNVTGLATKVMPKGLVDGDDRVPLSRGYVRGVHGLVLSCGIDWTTKLWAPAYTDKPILTLLSHSYDYMCDVQW